MAGGGRPDVSSDATDGGPSPTVLSLVLPLHDTTGTDRDWLAGHLWYLTDYLLLLVLLPVGMLAARRIRPTVAAALLGLVVLEAGPALGLPTLTGAARVGVGDLLCYGLFAVLGIAWATRPPTALTSGTDFPTLLRERITEPEGLATVELRAEEQTGWVGSASGGVAATPADVTVFFDALVNRGEVLTQDGLRVMTDLNHLNGGLGVWPMCPCGESPDGTKWAAGLGHFTGDGAAFAFPNDRLAICLRIGGGVEQPVSGERIGEMRNQLTLLMRQTATMGGVCD